MVLISQNAPGLQQCLNKISCYFDKRKLKLNIYKTKILIFNKSGKIIKGYKFIYKGRTIEIAESYQYLGLVFSNNGNFNKAINILREKGRKAVYLYILMRKLSNYNVTLGIKLFHVFILPILTYAFEVWAEYVNDFQTKVPLIYAIDKVFFQLILFTFTVKQIMQNM